MQRLDAEDRFPCLLKGLLNWRWRIVLGALIRAIVVYWSQLIPPLIRVTRCRKGANEEALKNLSGNILLLELPDINLDVPSSS